MTETENINRSNIWKCFGKTPNPNNGLHRHVAGLAWTPLGIRAHGQNNWRLNPEPGLNPFEFLVRKISWVNCHRGMIINPLRTTDDPDPDDHSPQKPSFDRRKTIF